jgi:hypothetical protein
MSGIGFVVHREATRAWVDAGVSVPKRLLRT